MRTATSARDGQVPETLEDRLLARVTRAGAFRELGEFLKGGGPRSVLLGGLCGSSRLVAVAWLARKSASAGGGPVLLVLPDTTAHEDAREDLRFLLGNGRIASYPDVGISPYSSNHPKVPQRAGRIETLAALLGAGPAPLVVLTTVNALLKKVPRPERFRRSLRRVALGETIDQDDFLAALVRLGFDNQALVGEYGDMSRRGGIVDVYTFGLENPVRIEWDGDEIASIREFDVFSQRSVRQLRDVHILPMWECLVEPGDWDGLKSDGGGPGEALEFLRGEVTFAGQEWMARHFAIPMGSMLDYLPDGSVVLADDPLTQSQVLAKAHEEIREAYDVVSAGGEEAAPGMETPWTTLYGDPATCFAMEEEPAAIFGEHPTVFLTTAGHELPGELDAEGLSTQMSRHGVDIAAASREFESLEGGDRSKAVAQVPGTTTTARPLTLRTRPQEKFGRNVELTGEYVSRLRDRGLEVWILCDTASHRERLEELLAGADARFEVGNLAGGFEIPEVGLAVLTDHEIFSRLRRRTAGRRYSRGISLKELLAMSPGDFVVHIDHGVGVYRGIQRLIVNSQETDCMRLEYAGGDKLYIPVDQLDLVQRYSAEEGVRPTLSRLGSGQWQKTKARVKKSVKEMAGQLLRTYAIRKSRPGHAFGPDTVWQVELEQTFPYEETPDQDKAIEEVREDLMRTVPMERLICGDVGYGKTEVALRAAFKVAMEGKQVAILVPTTLLAQQHHESFRERLEKYPVRVEMLSRFRSTKEQKAVVQDLALGTVDIVIGTHRLLSKDVAFRDLGLLIVDEEHRFGVAHKEKLKQLREVVDYLSMTATPIPRTMHMALLGAMDMSIIRTPPKDRMPVQTELVEFREDVISYALMREADRGGQSFFVHNRIESIDAMAGYIRRVVPHLRVAVAHGQMRERQLETVMRNFLAGEYDVLVSTMIIEAGLDMPNVNTILVNRVDTFGLAQLYQLRGRVGRSSRKAYAYLLLPPAKTLTEPAQKRLKAIDEFNDLGSGFQLAMRDLEIRGAGNLLGAEQHGFIVNVGFDLYTRLLEEAVRELKGLPAPERVEARIVTDMEAYLPDDYVADSKEKMNLYKSLADTVKIEQVEELAAEIEDRFGKLPAPGEHLMDLRKLRIRASRAGVATLTLRGSKVELEMSRGLEKDEVRRMVAGMPFEVEFQSHGRHRVRVRKPKDVSGTEVAAMLMGALEG